MVSDGVDEGALGDGGGVSVAAVGVVASGGAVGGDCAMALVVDTGGGLRLRAILACVGWGGRSATS
jgi:hypothetical protein